MPEKEPLGFIGLGIMGFPMAENLIKAGYPLTVFNRTRSKAEGLGAGDASRFVKIANSPAEVARQAQVIFLCLGGSADVGEVTEGMLETVKPGSLVVDCTTISPSASRRIAEQFRQRGAEFLDAPCSGSKKGAINATLTFMVGGNPQAFERAKPYLSLMGQKVFYAGGQGMGLQVKLSQNLIGALTCQAMAEGFVLARKAGLSPSLVLEILQASVARNPLIEGKMRQVLERRFEPHFSLKWMYKDVELMLESGRELHVPLPATALVHELFEASIAAGHGEEDFASAITLLESLAGVTVEEAPQGEGESGKSPSH